MQEYVEERTIAISVKAAKLSGKVLAAACKKVFAEIAKQQEAAKRPKGRQSVRKLMNHHGGKNAMKIEKDIHGRYERAGFSGFQGSTEWMIATRELLDEMKEMGR